MKYIQFEKLILKFRRLIMQRKVILFFGGKFHTLELIMQGNLSRQTFFTDTESDR